MIGDVVAVPRSDGDPMRVIPVPPEGYAAP